MRLFLKSIMSLLLITNFLEAKVGVCEVQPEDKKEQFLECLVKEAERTDDVADINMVANGYGVYAMRNEIIFWRDKAIKKGSLEAIYGQADTYSFFVISNYKLENGTSVIPKIIKELLVDYPQELNQPKKAIELYKQATLLHYKDSIAKLSELMEVVYGKEGAVKQYEKEMADGDNNTYRFLANLYVRYEEYDKALNLYEAQLEKDPENAELYTWVGNLYNAYYYKNKKKAEQYYKKGAVLGSSKSMYELGVLAKENKEYKEAEEWFRTSEKAGRKYTLGKICDMHQFQLDNDDEAEKCNLELAKKGDHKDKFKLGTFYMDMGRKNENKLIALGRADANGEIGVDYYIDNRNKARKLSAESYEKAVKWLTEAYDEGSSFAALALGYYYDKHSQKEEAIYWYEKAAAMGESTGWSYLYNQEVFK